MAWLVEHHCDDLGKLVLSIAVLEYLGDGDGPSAFTDVVQEIISDHLTTVTKWYGMRSVFKVLRKHLKIGSLHKEIVWETFLEERKIKAGYAFEPTYTADLREKLRNGAVRLVRSILPAANVSSRVNERYER